MLVKDRVNATGNMCCEILEKFGYSFAEISSLTYQGFYACMENRLPDSEEKTFLGECSDYQYSRIYNRVKDYFHKKNVDAIG